MTGGIPCCKREADDLCGVIYRKSTCVAPSKGTDVCKRARAAVARIGVQREAGFLALLVWAGLLNDDFGVVNHLLGHVGIHVPWLFDANWARVSVILVSVWLTTPYFFLVSMGALQSIPAELTEAARVDGVHVDQQQVAGSGVRNAGGRALFRWRRG